MQKRRYASGLLVLLLLLSTFGPTAGARAAVGGTPDFDLPMPAGFSELADEELAEVSGQWAYVAAGAGIGALASGISYLVTTPKDDWKLKDAAKHVAAGLITGAIGSLTGSFTSPPAR